MHKGQSDEMDQLSSPEADNGDAKSSAADACCAEEEEVSI